MRFLRELPVRVCLSSSKNPRLSGRSEGKPEVGEREAGDGMETVRRESGPSNFLSLVPVREGFGAGGGFQLASPRGARGMRVILSWGTPRHLIFGPGRLSWKLGSEPVDREGNREVELQRQRAKSRTRRRPAPLLACGGWMPGAEASP